MDRFDKTLVEIWDFEERESSCSVKIEKDCFEGLCIDGVFGTKICGLGKFLKGISDFFSMVKVVGDSFWSQCCNLLTIFGRSKHLSSPGFFAFLQLDVKFTANFAA